MIVLRGSKTDHRKSLSSGSAKVRLGVWAVFALFGQPLFAQTELIVDARNEFQVVDNFGASDAWSIQPILSKWMIEERETAIENLADLLFSTDKGIGLSAWRFNIGAGSAEQGSESRIPDPLRRAELMMAAPGAKIDPAKQAGQIRMLREAHERGVRDLIVFANSPPVWATKNGLSHPGDGTGIGSSNLDPQHRQAFVEFLVDVVQYLREGADGIPVNYISPINEPTWEWEGQTQEGTPYNVREIKEVYRALQSALERNGLSDVVHVDGPEAVEYTAALRDEAKMEFDGKLYEGGMNQRGVGLYRNYIDEFLGDEEMREILDGKVSLHGYFSDAWEDRLGELRDVTWKNVNQVAPGARVWMSEFCILGAAGNARTFTGGGFDPDDMDFALHVGKVIHRDLTRLNASAWQWWLAVTPYDYKDGLLKISPTLEPETLQTSKAFWVLGNFSRFIRPGFQRVQVTNPDALDGLMVSAYRSPDRDESVVVIVNGGDSARVRLRSAISGEAFHSGTTRIFVTDEARSLEEVRWEEEITVPQKSVVTVISKTVSKSMGTRPVRKTGLPATAT